MPQATREMQGYASILEIALEVHMAATGSSEMSVADMNEYVGVLEAAVRHWEPPTISKRFDDAVFELISAALEEYRRSSCCSNDATRAASDE